MRKERSCISCGEKAPGTELLRWLNVNGKIFPDWIGNLEGRAIYTHLNAKCIRELYDRKGFSSKFYQGSPEHQYPRDQIAAHLRTQAQRSIEHFLSLAKKSGVVTKGQNLIVARIKEGAEFKYCFYASDASERTVRMMQKNLVSVQLISFDKKSLGNFFDGRDTAVFALDASEISDKIVFYINVFENFISGDIDAN